MIIAANTLGVLARKMLAATLGRVRQDDPLQSLLFPTRTRLLGLGIFVIANHLMLGLLHSYTHSPTFDSLWLRLPLAATGLPLVFGPLSHRANDPRVRLLFGLMFWLHLPFVLSFLFIMNNGADMQLASMMAMLLVYYQLTDWRLASVGTASGLLVGGALALVMHVPHFATPWQTGGHLVFIWALAAFLGWSTGNLRRDQLRHTIDTLKVVDNDVRPGISAMLSLGKTLRAEARTCGDMAQAARLKSWGRKLQDLGFTQRATLNSQIANAHLLDLGLASDAQVLVATHLIADVVRNYPYSSERERGCLRMEVLHDFNFIGSPQLFTQVLGNLIRNALQAVTVTRRIHVPGDVLIEVNVRQGRGQIVVVDRGVGMSPTVQRRAFDAFYSTNKRASHGLGLTFCRQVIVAAGGTIEVESIPGFGATFTLEFPIEEHGNSLYSQTLGSPRFSQRATSVMPPQVPANNPEGWANPALNPSNLMPLDDSQRRDDPTLSSTMSADLESLFPLSNTSPSNPFRPHAP